MNPDTHYFRLYKTPPVFDDMIMESDGEALIGLLFVDGNNTDFLRRLICQYLRRLRGGSIFISAVASLILCLIIR